MARVRLFRTVRGDFPFLSTFADYGEHEAKVNPQGAVSVKACDGSWLGVKPSEFEWVDEPPRPERGELPSERWLRARVRELEARVRELEGRLATFGDGR